MKKHIFSMMLLGCMALGANAQQLPNADFEGEWTDCYPWEKGSKGKKAYGQQPEGWCVSNVPNELASPMASQVDGVSGKGVNLTNTAALGNGIPAYMTLGTTWATAETKLTNTRNKDGGVFGGIEFAYRPDAIRMAYKREGTSEDETMIVAYSWKGTWTQASVPSNTAVGVFSWGSAVKTTMTDRDNNILGLDCNTGGTITPSEDAELIATAQATITEFTSEWKEILVPIEYKTLEAQPEKFNIVIAAAGYHSENGVITEGLSLTVDNVELVYYHALSSLSYNGQSVAGFSEDALSYDLSSETYDESKLEFTVKGVGAKAETSYDDETQQLTITVTGDNGEATAYTLQFGKRENSIESLAAEEKNPVYDLAGRRAKAATKGIYIVNGKKMIK